MPDTLEQRVSKLEIDGARIQEQYSQILQQLSAISGQLSAFNSTFVRKDLCEQAHKSIDRENYDWRHTLEKRIVESDGILAGEIQKIEKRMLDFIEKLDKKHTDAVNDVSERISKITNRLWSVIIPTLGGLVSAIIYFAIRGGIK